MEYSGYVEPGKYDQVVFRATRRSGLNLTRSSSPSGSRVVGCWRGVNANVWDVVKLVQNLVRAKKPVDRQRLADPFVSPGGSAYLISNARRGKRRVHSQFRGRRFWD